MMVEIEVSYDPDNPFLSTYSENFTSYQDTCSSLFIASLFAMARKLN